MNYIKFIKNDTLTVEIHYKDKLRVIENKANVDKILSICEKYGYERINKSCYLKEYVDEIVKDYGNYYNKRKNTVKIYNTIKDAFKLKKKVFNKKILAIGTLTCLAAFNPYSKEITSNEITVTEENNVDNLENDEIINITKNIKKTDSKEVTISKEELEKTDSEEQATVKEEKETTNELNTMLNKTTEFVFSYNNENIANLETTKNYSDIFQKYGEMYGIDSNLLMAIASQESGGKHDEFLYNYPAVGIMQIERSAFLNKEITAYNHLEQKQETFLITEEALTNLDTNIKIGTMLLQIALEANDYNIPLGIQTYNFGTSYMNQALKMCEAISGIPVEEMKQNMQETEWRYYREFLNIGDSNYVEHVLSFLPNDEKITVKNRDNEDISLKIVNEAVKTKTI